MRQKSTLTTLSFTTIWSLVMVFVLCDRCPDGDNYCLACANDRCTICMAGFIDASGVCRRAPKKIFRCVAYDDSGKCLACKYGYFLDADGQCYEIPDSNCMLYDQKQNCVMCADGLRPENGSCYKAQSKCATANCRYCIVSADGLEHCHQCDEGFAVSLRASSVPDCLPTADLTANCWVLSAIDDSKCAVCRYNYFYNKGSCEKSLKYWIDMGTKIGRVTAAVIFLMFSIFS